MANSTDPFAVSVHGMNPQNLVEKIMRNRIYASLYWKDECFGLTAETLVDKASELEYIGGNYGGNQKPTPFLCLLLKMFQLQPEDEIVIEFIRNENFKYVTALGAIYMRMVGKAIDIYQHLEPLYSDYRKLRYRTTMGWKICHMDEFVDDLLNEEYVCDLAMPRITTRIQLEQTLTLKPRRSPLEDELDDEE